MSTLRQLASALRAGIIRATTPAVPSDPQTDFALSWLNEATLVGISVPPPRSNR